MTSGSNDWRTKSPLEWNKSDTRSWFINFVGQIDFKCSNIKIILDKLPDGRLLSMVGFEYFEYLLPELAMKLFEDFQLCISSYQLEVNYQDKIFKESNFCFKNIKKINLFEYLSYILENDDGDWIKWINKERKVFKILNPEIVGKFYGFLRFNSKTNYKTMSRVLRYWYKKDTGIKKYHGFYVYRLCKKD